LTPKGTFFVKRGVPFGIYIMKKLNISEQKFERLTVLNFSHSHNGHCYWNVLCDCGNERKVTVTSLRGGGTKSCGCLRTESRFGRNKTHGMRKTRFYAMWWNIQTRCNNPNSNRHYIYGARGIRCLWKSFEEFKNDMYEPYLEHCEKYDIKNTSIDRINTNGNYEKSNCRFSTNTIQMRNKRNNRILKFKEQEKCLAEWSEIVGIKVGTLWSRLNRNHWSVEKALTTPVKT